jgi:hypothetical protein
MFLSSVLKINILTLDIANHAGFMKIMGGSVGAVCGSVLSAVGIPPNLGTSLGILIGKNIGDVADSELREINQKLKIAKNKNDEFLENEKVEQMLVNKFDKSISSILNTIATNINRLSEEDKKLCDDGILTKLVLNIFQDEDRDFSSLFFANLFSDERIRENLIKIIKNA